MPEAKILMIGNCVLDEIWTLDHYPQEDEEMRAENRDTRLGGNACNSAQFLAQLGDDVALMTTLANDADARWMLGQLAESGVSTRDCRQIEKTASPKSVIWLNRQNGSRSIVHYRNLPELEVTDLLSVDTRELCWLHLEGRNIECLLEALPKMRLPCPLSLEIEKPRPKIEKLLPLVNSVIVSKAYLSARGIDARQCIEEFQRINPALGIICTLGERGVIAVDGNASLFELTAEPVKQVIDSIGAGDCFIAGFIHQRLRAQAFPAAVAFANRLAANKIQQRGIHINV